MTASQSPPEVAEGVVDPDHLYTLQELSQRTGWRAGSFRTARRNGLQVKYAGRQCFIQGSDFISYVRSQGKDER